MKERHTAPQTAPLALLALLVCLPGTGAAQTGAVDSVAGAPYLIPQTVFVGDEGRLVVPLSSAYPGQKPEVQDDAAMSAASRRDLVITRVELENWGTPRLLIDFRAYTPGTLRMPPIMIGSSLISGLDVTIASILDAGEDSRILSPPAAPLAAPGTLWLIYGSAAFVLLLFVLTGWGFFGFSGGIAGLRAYREKRLRLRRIKRIGKIRRIILAGLDGEASGGESEALAHFSVEFRDFLGLFTGMNCRAMVPAEFFRLPALFGERADPLTGRFLGELFRRWDTLRFRGGTIARPAARELFEDVRLFIEALDRAERERRVLRRVLRRVSPGERRQ